MRRLLFCAGVLPLLAGCAPTISALHDPLYRAENHTSTITARANDAKSGIAEIRIEAVVGELTACTGAASALPSLVPCRAGATQMNAVCDYPNVKAEVTCTLPIAITPQRLVTYRATTRNASGRTASTNSVTFAGGAPLTHTHIKLLVANLEMPWETARPVIWRTDAPSKSADRGGQIDWGFVPDADMPSYRAFTDDMQPMVLSVLYTDGNRYSAWTRSWKNIFNVWAGPAGGDGEGCTRTFAEPAASVRAAFDGTGILHRNAFRDCASISLGGGSGTTQTNLGDAPWVMVHEAGHYLFGLGDEYVGGGNWSISNPRNVFPSKAECETTSTANGLAATQCVQIGASGTWRNDDGQATTMEDRVLSSDWRTLSGKALSNHLASCINGACY